MNRYNASSLTATQCLFTSALPVLFYIRTVGGVWLLPIIMVGILVMLSTSGGIFYCLRTVAISMLLLCIAFFSLQNAFKLSSFSCGIIKENICEIEGIVIYDSSFSGMGNSILKLYVYECNSVYGIKSTSRGVVTAVAKPDVSAMALSKIKIKGSFSDDLFIADDVVITDFIRTNEIRTQLIGILGRNLKNGGDSFRLCCSLILGMAYEDGVPLRNKARQCGCLHVLALSGMHLGVIVKMCRIFGKNRFSEILSIVLACLFIFIAGPRPSLIRAFLSFFAARIFRKSDIGTVLVYVITVQSILFPVTVCDIGFVYCYCSICAITVMSPVLKSCFSQLMPEFVSSFIASQLSVVIINAIIQIILDGCWSPGVIVASLPASFIAEAIMFCGIFIIIFGPLPVLNSMCSFLYSCLEFVFDVCGNLFKPASWGLYSIVVVFLLLVIALLIIRKQIIKNKFFKKIEVREPSFQITEMSNLFHNIAFTDKILVFGFRRKIL